MTSLTPLRASMALVAGAAICPWLIGCSGDAETNTGAQAARSHAPAAPFTGELAGSEWIEREGWLAGAEGSAGDQRITLVLRVRAKGGSEAVQILRLRKRAARGSVRCGGRRYDAGVLSEATGEAGNGWFGIDDQGGTATLSITRAIEVQPALRAPADCLELAGRWTGASGALRGQSDSFSYSSPPGKTEAATRFR